MQGSQNLFCENSPACAADAFYARPDPAPGCCDFFIRNAFDALLKIDEPRADEDWMSVGIHKAGKDHFSCAVDFDNVLAILFQPGVAERGFGGADRNKFTAKAEDSAIFDDAEFFEAGPAARATLIRSMPKRQQLADIDEQQWLRRGCFGLLV